MEPQQTETLGRAPVRFLPRGRTARMALLFCALLAGVLLCAVLTLPPLAAREPVTLLRADPAAAFWQPRADKVNLNTAVAAELMTLPGIGEKRAQSILACRAAHGPFADVQALGEAEGISEKILAEIAPYVCVS